MNLKKIADKNKRMKIYGLQVNLRDALRSRQREKAQNIQIKLSQEMKGICPQK